MQATTDPTQQRQGLTGRHVLAHMVGLFGIVFAVNGYMLFKALSTHSGLVANEPYRKGLEYNRRIAADERQAALGWTSDATLDDKGTVTVTIADPTGQPVSRIALEGRLGRPSSNRADVPLIFKEVAAGRYRADAGAISAGTWQLDVAIRPEAATTASAGEPIYRFRRRLWVKP